MVQLLIKHHQEHRLLSLCCCTLHVRSVIRLSELQRIERKMLKEKSFILKRMKASVMSRPRNTSKNFMSPSGSFIRCKIYLSERRTSERYWRYVNAASQVPVAKGDVTCGFFIVSFGWVHALNRWLKYMLQVCMAVGVQVNFADYTGLFISPSGTSELDCATTKTYIHSFIHSFIFIPSIHTRS